MATSFKKVCVIGAGVMGQGIAAHVANARIPVLLLDIVPKGRDEEGLPWPMAWVRHHDRYDGPSAA